ncbi:hypothetical protein PTTG_05517 [Puccinia triticina 1-1 BBBD Race 1]|uniref:Trehalase n=2 Tax=Puccinia triticina TaxID=208348 RepID=A0A0C4EXG9_PUCT1|nr:uncharacterized protein PtA15_9A485 [Puccinia triticina]OAV98453.1 hypothetical protein PTTG_05517 [Puccinia triticina 1-1 BBBD Race 1]WAQ88358.1 hypothetical protein PtA15_9A485 [Puccinia triticina]WAR60536.1 hypothetical protein PtB15_9B475 [Puccinia triticina]
MRFPAIQPAADPTNHLGIQTTQSEHRRAGRDELEKLVLEISLRWSSLVRSNSSLGDLLEDPKLPLPKGDKRKLYVHTLPGSAESLAAIRTRLGHENPSGELDNLDIRELPPKRFFPNLADHGTLYLPYPYVVPGGRFQEMYAWDSFFIALGLLRDNHVRLARNMLDNYIYQIEHYGTILNGNRTYYLTRSQLPFLTPLIKLVLPTVAPSVRQAWLRKALAAAEKYHLYWTSGSHLTSATGLSRFFDFGPPGSAPPEIIHETDPRDGSSAHHRVKSFFREHYHKGIPDYDISKYYNYETDELTAKFMDNDRAMRESGFDTSSRFGPFNSKILDFNPVCLNSLLYLMEKEIGELYEKLEPWKRMSEAGLSLRRSEWKSRATKRRALVQRYNWDETQGLFFDYDFVKQARREYVFGTTFLPLWTGLADPEQARRVAEKGVAALEIPGGLSTSATVVGDQWDKPYVWAPLQLFAVDGLRKYGFDIPADRLAANFASMVLKTWRSSGQLWEKYDGVKRNQSVELKFGYPTNETGFGWTNALFTHFYDHLKAVGKLDDILLLDGLPLPGQDQSLAINPSNEADLSVEDIEAHEWVEIGIDHSRPS